MAQSMTLSLKQYTRPVVTIAVFFMALLCCYWMALGVVRFVEETARLDVSDELIAEGHFWPNLQTDGLQIIVGGEAPSEADRFSAITVVGTLVNPANVIDNTSVAEAQKVSAPQFSIEMMRNDTGISLIGLIPAVRTSADIEKQVQRIDPEKTVANFMQTADHPEPEGWQSALSFGLIALEHLTHSKITVGEDHVYIIATAQSPDDKQKLIDLISRKTPDGIETRIDISAPRPVITPFAMRAVLGEDGLLFDSCSSDGPQSTARLKWAAAAAGFEGRFVCNEGLGSPSPDWTEGALLGLGALRNLGMGTLTISDANLSLLIKAGPTPEKFEAAIKELKEKLPSLFRASAVLSAQSNVDDAQGGGDQFFATLSPEGHLHMRGAVAAGWSHNAVLSFAEAKFGVSNIFDKTEIYEQAPNGWGIRVMVGLTALSKLNSGLVEVSPDHIKLSGRTGNQQANAIVANAISEELGDVAAFNLDITYVKSLDPNANLLKPVECVARVQDIIKSDKIVFEPGSDNFDINSTGTIKRIATILERCPEAVIEIAAHSDSQGREEMNLRLSQSRAEAVLNALRVTMKGLSAKGYGETIPIADNGTAEGREENRRIEFSVITDQTEAPSEEQTDG